MSAISEIMSPKAVTINIHRNPSTLDVAKLMVKNKVGSVVIVDNSSRPVGIITERDILKKISALNKNSKDILAKNIMSSPLITVKAYDSIDSAAAIMTKNKIKRLVVLEQDRTIAGILSITDITKKMAKILADDYNRYRKLRAIIDSKTMPF